MSENSEQAMQPFKPIEQEIILLKAALNLINEMVNHRTFSGLKGGVTEVRPTDEARQRLFNILLADFLDKPDATSFDLAKPSLVGFDDFLTLLHYLRHIVQNPILNQIDPEVLGEPVEIFATWLNTEFTIDEVWLSAIGVKANLTMRRVEYIKICGNIAKHSFSRLSWNVSLLRKLLERNGIVIGSDQAYMALPDFYTWFHDHVLSYHIGQIAALLNDVRWGIYDYLRPAFGQAFTPKPHPTINWYEYKYPVGVERLLARSIFWDLMNDVRDEPYVPRFSIVPILTQRY